MINTTPFLFTLLSILMYTMITLTGCSYISNNQSQSVPENLIAPNESIEATITTTPPDINDIITLAKISQDVAYLSSDELQGRSNFGKEIHVAADYIASRFHEVGLTTIKQAPLFKQSYTVQQRVPNDLKVELNGQTISQQQLAFTSTLSEFKWQTGLLANTISASASNHNLKNNLKNKSEGVSENNAKTNITYIGDETNMRKSLYQLNQQGGNHLVILHPKHEKSFHRYQSYFSRGSTQLIDERPTPPEGKNEIGGAIVIVLSDITKVNQLKVTGTTRKRNTELKNIVGVLPGKSKANEIVLYSAHYDHIGTEPVSMETPLKKDLIFNGADDDASGVSAVINLANYFAKTDNNERTLMFVAFSAEEIGGYGSKYFSQHISPDNITAMINIEMIGKPSVFGEGKLWMTGMERSSLGNQLNSELAARKLKLYADPYPNEKLFYRSDNATLARLGVAAHSFSSTQLDKDKHYHHTSDELNTLDLPSMLEAIKLLAIATKPLAQGRITPSRITKQHVKPSGVIY